MRTLAHAGVLRRLRAARVRFRADDLGTMAAALTYQAFLSLFPLMLLALSVAGFVLSGKPADVLEEFYAAIPGIGPLLLQNLDHIVSARASLGLIALLGVVWTASGLTSRATAALGRIYRIPDRGIVRRRGRSLLAMLVLGAALIAGLVLSGAIANLEADGWLGTVVRVIAFLGVAALEFAFFWGTYAILTPNGGPPNRAHIPGALLMTLSWEVMKLVGGVLVVRTVAKASLLYGTIGAVFGLLIFLRVASAVYLVGAELSAILREEQTQITGP